MCLSSHCEGSSTHAASSGTFGGSATAGNNTAVASSSAPTAGTSSTIQNVTVGAGVVNSDLLATVPTGNTALIVSLGVMLGCVVMATLALTLWWTKRLHRDEQLESESEGVANAAADPERGLGRCSLESDPGGPHLPKIPVIIMLPDNSSLSFGWQVEVESQHSPCGTPAASTSASTAAKAAASGGTAITATSGSTAVPLASGSTAAVGSGERGGPAAQSDPAGTATASEAAAEVAAGGDSSVSLGSVPSAALAPATVAAWEASQQALGSAQQGQQGEAVTSVRPPRRGRRPPLLSIVIQAPDLQAPPPPPQPPSPSSPDAQAAATTGNAGTTAVGDATTATEVPAHSLG